MKAPEGWTISPKQSGHDLTFTYRQGALRRVLTVDIRSVPSQASDMQKWFIALLGRIWWDITEPESFVITTRVADRMAQEVAKHRESTA